MPGVPALIPFAHAANRRLTAGLMLSLIVHALILSLQFGPPGMALQGARPAIHITLAQVRPDAPEVIPDPVAPERVPPAPPQPQLRAPVAGMRLVDPVATPEPIKEPAKAAKKAKKAPRVSAPFRRPELDAAIRVIAQDSRPDSEFVVPLPQPEEAPEKTIDPAEAQHGSDVAAEVQAEAAPAAAGDGQARLLAQQKADEERLASEQEMLAQQRREQDALAQEKAGRLLAQQRLEQEVLERRKAEELIAQQRRVQDELERQKSDELVAQQRREQELAERKKADDVIARQRIAQEIAERKRLEELAAQRLAQERARQQAEREREAALARQAPAGDPFGSAEGQGGGARPGGASHGSDLANRVRDLSKGLDLLTGAPPARPRPEQDRQARRMIADSGERDVPVRLYVESWRQKIERNGNLNFPKLIGERARIDPLVSVAVRSDGSVEDVTIIRSSGRADTDDAVRRIVRINALYSRFPPNIASRYDVIEIRRTWRFDQVLKLIEEIR